MATAPSQVDHVVEAIISNHPMTSEEDRTRKRQAREATTWVATLIPGLHDDVVRRILACLPRTNWRNLFLVSKAWRKTLEDPFFCESRVELGLTEEWLYTEAWNPATKIVSWFALDPTESKWLALPPIPKTRGLDPEVFGRAAASASGELYVMGGKAGISGPTLREMFVYSPFTNRWRKGKSMHFTRHNPLVFEIFGRKIYVIGGFDFLNNVIDTAECYDIDTDEWAVVGNHETPKLICPKWYHRGWQAQWLLLSFNGDEYYICYKTKEWQQVVQYYLPRKGEWVYTTNRDRSKALLRYSVGSTVNNHIVMLDWANGKIRYCYFPTREVLWLTVPGVAELDWVSILSSNPKTGAFGSKLVLVGRGLSVLMIETCPHLLQNEEDMCFIDTIPAKPKAAELELEAISCVTIRV